MSSIKSKIVLLLLLLMMGTEVYSQSYIYGLFGDKFRTDVNSHLSGLGKFKFGGDLFIGTKRLDDGRFAIVAKGKLYQPTIHPNWSYVGNHHVFADVSGIPSASTKSTDNYYITARVRYGNLKLADRETEVIVKGGWNEDYYEILYYCTDEENESFNTWAPHSKLVAGEIDVNSVPIAAIRGYLNKLKIEEETKKTVETKQLKSIDNGSSGFPSSAPALSSTKALPTQASKTSTPQNKSTASSQNTSSPNRASNDIYDRAERAGKTLQQMEYEREAYQRQQQERLQQATNPGGYYMEKSGLNAYFDAQHERLNREAAEKEAREEREWLARKRREEREVRENERRAEEYRRKKETEQKENREKRLADYKARGGDLTYKMRLDKWRTFATQEIHQVNTFLTRYGSYAIGFQYPENNCDYVQAIEYIQNSTMPNDYKDVLIRNVLKVRLEYYLFYRENGFVSENWKVGKDDIYHSPTYAPCGNYLDVIASSLTIPKIEGDLSRTTSGYGIYHDYDIGGMDAEYKQNDPLNIHSERNYHVPVGAYPAVASFKNDVREAGITMHERQLQNASGITLSFQNKTFDWSKGAYFREGKYNYTDGLNYQSNALAGKPDLIKIEVDRIKEFHEIKRKFRLNSVEDERNMMYFTYQAGDKESAYNHFLRYVELKYGSWQLMMQTLRKDDLEDLSSTTDQPVTVVAFATLLMDNGQYGNALEMINILHDIAKNLKTKDLDKASAVSRAAVSLHNKIAYRMQKYDKMSLPKDETEIKNYHKNTDAIFKFIPRAVKGGDVAKRNAAEYNREEPIRLKNDKIEYLVNDDVHLKASALIKLGKPKLAEELIAPMLNYYSNKKPMNPLVKKHFPKAYKNRDNPKFYGDETDINAMKEVVVALDAGKHNEYQYALSTRLLLMKKAMFNYKHLYSFLQPWYVSKLTPINSKAVDLVNSEEWKLIKSNLNRHNGSRQAIKGLYDQMDDVYKNARLEPNDETRNFLIGYIQMGTALARFHDIIPAIAEKQRLFPEDGIMLEEKLAVLMYPVTDNVFTYDSKKVAGQQYREITYRHPIGDYFQNEVKNSEHLKGVLNTYLSIWARDKVSSPMIPYLYHTLAEDGEMPSSSNQRNGVQSTSPDGYIQTNSGLKYKITRAVYSGNTVKDGETHFYHYICKLTDGTVMDNSYSSGPPYMSIIEKGRFLPGFHEAIKLLKPGEKGSFILPPNLAYGNVGRGQIPPNATLLYEIEVLDNKKQ